MSGYANMGARLSETVSCPECCFTVKPLINFYAKPRAEVQCPRPECKHVWTIKEPLPLAETAERP